MGKDYRYVGKLMPRQDAADIVTGTVQYMDDRKFQNLLYGKVLRSPYAHANIKKIDKSKAEALPGVRAVVTWEDIPDWRGGTPRNVRILDKKVRYVGDAVALVAATTEEIAEEALDLIDVEYEVLPAVFDIDSACSMTISLETSCRAARSSTGLIASRELCRVTWARDLPKRTSSAKGHSAMKTYRMPWPLNLSGLWPRGKSPIKPLYGEQARLPTWTR